MRIIQWFIGLLFLMVFFLLLPVKGLADSSGFYVTPVIPENQLKDTKDYFNLSVPAAMEQTLEFVIVNESDESKDFHLTLFDGMTTNDGTISYDNKHKYSDSQKYKISKIAQLEKNEVTVEPNSSETIKIQLKDTISDFFGMILGAVNVSQQEETDKKEGISNSFAYNIPIIIRVAEENNEYKLTYDGLTVNVEKVNKALEMTFQNPNPNIVRRLNLTFSIYQKGDQATPLYKSEMKEIELAPNSMFTPELSLTEAKLKAGQYVLKIDAKSDAIDEYWKSEFKLSSAEEQSINGGVEVFSENNRMWMIIIAAVLVLGGVGYVLYKKKS
ncbi:hypothetical protein A5819_003572 [Enterococcus sp. 7E2_DIV0204]|uniref:DUF916 and DUF3324 domain-containing protein n=1 Tax=unclassified Enterococcus TaxID=2608891 RepID=UPI000A3472C1|nr:MULTISPECIES: DUF916 and DUF3324 domain-containing protein [unclassified Enterococcus]OTN84022.1 hypothetical protein A5819_003572 [Enterococcus sp. 7E2_DIV0204]OTP47195.1 hypothetical protein A5884_003570 [Enterococcus sp. 7D2_DIV0200]